MPSRLPFDEGMQRERELFETLRDGDQSKAQRHVFFAEREVAQDSRRARRTRRCCRSRSVAVIGAGTMGGGIAMACANAGLPVTVDGPRAGCARQGPRHDRARTTPATSSAAA